MRSPKGRLQDYLAKVARDGETDCAMFQDHPVGEITRLAHLHRPEDGGVDLAAPWRDKYTGYRQGLRAMRLLGYKNPRDFIASISVPVQNQDVVTGDLCFIGNAGGVFIGNKVFALGHNRKSLAVTELPEGAEIYRITGQCQH